MGGRKGSKGNNGIKIHCFLIAVWFIILSKNNSGRGGGSGNILLALAKEGLLCSVCLSVGILVGMKKEHFSFMLALRHLLQSQIMMRPVL